MKPLLLLAAIAFCAAQTQAQPVSLTAAQVATRVANPLDFAPRGWRIEKQISGDLNRDNLADRALVLCQDLKSKDAEGKATARARALVVVLREGDVWSRAGFNASILLGTRDGGAFYGVMETPVGVSIERSVLEINQDNGSRQTTDVTFKFRLDKRAKRFYLIGSEVIINDRLAPNTRRQSTNHLTGRQKITQIGGEPEVLTTRVVRVSRKLRLLESVRGEERFSD